MLVVVKCALTGQFFILFRILVYSSNVQNKISKIQMCNYSAYPEIQSPIGLCDYLNSSGIVGSVNFFLDILII
jgi:hypothetical protein